MTQQIIRSLAFLLLIAVAADAANCPNLTYTDASNVTALTGSFSCGMGWYGAHAKGTTAFVADEGNCYYYSVYWPDSVCLYEKALTYFGIDPLMCRDSMRRYVEFHPFATVSPGQTLNAFRYSNSSTGDMYPATAAAESTVPSSISCSGGFTLPHSGSQPASVVANPTSDVCPHLRTWLGVAPTGAAELKEQYDSLRAYVENCAASDNDYSYRAFSRTDNDVQEYDPSDTTRYDTYRDWLLSVLYLNTTNLHYYCNCVMSMAGTFVYGKYNIPNAGLSVIRYLIDQAPCHDTSLLNLYNRSVAERHKLWLLGDTSYPEDTALPPLDSIGLGELLHHSSVTGSGYLPHPYGVSVNATPNPFKQETELTFSLNRMTYVSIAVYDVLGRMVWGDGKGRSLDAGAHTIHIDGASLPSGTLYARISTGFGEVKTVKLVKQ